METKSYQGCFKSVKEAGRGSAVFATFNTIERDGDVTLPNVFGSDQVASFVGADDWSAPTIGLARIRETKTEAIADFQFNLDMESATQWYKALLFLVGRPFVALNGRSVEDFNCGRGVQPLAALQ
jgi:hypothetical protein